MATNIYIGAKGPVCLVGRTKGCREYYAVPHAIRLPETVDPAKVSCFRCLRYLTKTGINLTKEQSERLKRDDEAYKKACLEAAGRKDKTA